MSMPEYPESDENFNLAEYMNQYFENFSLADEADSGSHHPDSSKPIKKDVKEGDASDAPAPRDNMKEIDGHGDENTIVLVTGRGKELTPAITISPPMTDLASVLQLIDQLSASDLRVLRSHILKLDLNLDLFSEVPIELRTNLASFITKADLKACLLTSSTWRRNFEQEDMVKAVANTHFAGMMQHAAALGVDPKDLLFSCINKHNLRSQGHFRSALYTGLWLEDEQYFTLDPTLHPTGPNWYNARRYGEILITPIPGDFKPIKDAQQLKENLVVRNMRYAAGRIAWQPANMPQPDNFLIIVDSLRTQSRKIFKVEELVQRGDWVRLSAIGNRLVVGQGMTHMYAWDLESNVRHTVKVPFRPERVATWNMTVAIVALGGGIYIWHVGKTVRALNLTGNNAPNWKTARDQFKKMASLDLLQWTEADAYPFVHPAFDNVYYIAKPTLEEATAVAWPHGMISIHQYEGNKCMDACVFDCASVPGIRAGNHRIWCHPKRANSHGLFSIATIRLNNMGSVDPDALAAYTHCASKTVPHYGWAVYTITFNVYTKEFGLSSHHPFGSSQFNSIPQRWHFWDGQLTWWSQDDMPRGMVGKFPVLTLNECQAEDKNLGLNPDADPAFYATTRPTKYTLRFHPEQAVLPLRRKKIDFEKAITRMLNRPAPLCRHIPHDDDRWMQGMPEIVRAAGDIVGGLHAYRMLFRGVNVAYGLCPDEDTLIRSGGYAHKLRYDRGGKPWYCSDDESDPELDRPAPGSSTDPGEGPPSRAPFTSHRSRSTSPEEAFPEALGLCRQVVDNSRPETVLACEAVFGDDDFMVLVHTQGFTVWAFDDDLPGCADTLKEKSEKRAEHTGQFWKRARIDLAMD